MDVEDEWVAWFAGRRTVWTTLLSMIEDVPRARAFAQLAAEANCDLSALDVMILNRRCDDHDWAMLVRMQAGSVLDNPLTC